MHSITKLHCTQYAHYTILQSYTVHSTHTTQYYKVTLYTVRTLHNITKLHCTQYAHYTILQSYTVHSTHTTQYYKVTQYAHYTILQSYTVRTLRNKSQYLGHLHVSKSNGPVDITTQHLFVAWKHCLYLNSFSTLTYMVISTIYTISSHKSIRLIQISDYAYKCKISIQFY